MCACSVDFWLTPRRVRKVRVVRRWDCENGMGEVGGVARPTKVRFAGREYIELP